jgi:SAM-dependent methyltransferase
MLAAGYACHAVEHSPQMVAAARENLHKRHLGSSGLIIQGSAQALPFSDCSFDNVISTFPTEYIYDPDTIAEIARVLRPSGHLIVIEGANLLPIGFLQPILLLLQTLVYGPGEIFRSRKNHPAGNAPQPQTPTPSANQQTNNSITTEIVTNASFGRHIPLERAGLSRRSEIARGKRWEISITIGEKVE